MCYNNIERNTQRNKMSTLKIKKIFKTPVFILIIIFLIFDIILISSSYKKLLNIRQASKTQNSQATEVDKSPLTQIEISKYPDYIPKNIPWEKDAAILDNYEFPAKTGTQYSRKYLSQKTLEENVAIYQKYLEDNKWKIVTDTNQADFKMFAATRPDLSGRLVITIAKSQVLGRITVEVSFIKK